MIVWPSLTWEYMHSGFSGRRTYCVCGLPMKAHGATARPVAMQIVEVVHIHSPFEILSRALRLQGYNPSI